MQIPTTHLWVESWSLKWWCSKFNNQKSPQISQGSTGGYLLHTLYQQVQGSKVRPKGNPLEPTSVSTPIVKQPFPPSGAEAPYHWVTIEIASKWPKMGGLVWLVTVSGVKSDRSIWVYQRITWNPSGEWFFLQESSLSSFLASWDWGRVDIEVFMSHWFGFFALFWVETTSDIVMFTTVTAAMTALFLFSGLSFTAI